MAALVGQLTVATHTYTKALAGVDAATLRRRPGPDSNSMLWIAGHLAQFRCRTARLLGAEMPIPWETLFSTGSHPGEGDPYPSGEELLALWHEVSADVARRLRLVNDAALDARTRERAPSTDGTLAGALSLFAFHEGYHLGQLGYLRKWNGLSSLFDG